MRKHEWITQSVLTCLHRLTDATDQVRLADVIRESGLDNQQAVNACEKLVQHGYLNRNRCAGGKVKPGQYTLTRSGRLAMEAGAKLISGPKGPHGKPKIVVNTLREKVWRALRIRQKLSAPEAVSLLCDADADSETLKRMADNVQKYLRTLRRAGYLADMRREPGSSLTSNGFKRYLLVRDTGSLAPVKRRNGNVYDPNDGKEYGIVA